MVRVVRRKDRFHLKLLAVIYEKPDFEFISAMVAPVQAEAVKRLMLAAGCLQNYRTVFVLLAGLVSVNINIHRFNSVLRLEPATPAGPQFMPRTDSGRKPVNFLIATTAISTAHILLFDCKAVAFQILKVGVNRTGFQPGHSGKRWDRDKALTQNGYYFLMTF